MRLDPEQNDVQYRSEHLMLAPRRVVTFKCSGKPREKINSAGRRCRLCAGGMVARVFGPTGYRSNFSITLSHKYSPIGMAEVAAGEGALHTCNERSLSAKRKSWTRLPSALTA